MAARFPTTGRALVGYLLVPALVLLILDRIAKALAVATWSTQPVQLLPGVRLSFLLNPGIIFSLPVGSTIATVVSIVIAVAFLGWFAIAWTRRMPTTLTALSILLLGAGSNLADRFLYHGVVDYLGLGSLTVVNLADALVLGGVVLLLTLRTPRT